MSAAHPTPGSHPPQEVATRERLLDTAEELFARRGYANASIRELTTCAECNIAAVNYHFGGKAGLYEAVFHRRLEMLRERRVVPIRALMERAEPATLEELLRTFVTAFLEPLLERSGGRTILQLMVRELLDPRLPREMLVERMLRPVQGTMVAALTRIEPGLGPDDALRGLHSIVGQLVHAIHVRQLFDADRTTFSALDLEHMVEHTVRFSAAGLRAFTPSPEAR